MQKTGKRFVCTSGAGTSQICPFKMPEKRPVASAAPCPQQKAVPYAPLRLLGWIILGHLLFLHLAHLKYRAQNEFARGKCTTSVGECGNVDYYFQEWWIWQLLWRELSILTEASCENAIGGCRLICMSGRHELASMKHLFQGNAEHLIKRNKTRHRHVWEGSSLGTCIMTSLREMLPFLKAFLLQTEASRCLLCLCFLHWVFILS